MTNDPARRPRKQAAKQGPRQYFEKTYQQLLQLRAEDRRRMAEDRRRRQREIDLEAENEERLESGRGVFNVLTRHLYARTDVNQLNIQPAAEGGLISFVLYAEGDDYAVDIEVRYRFRSPIPGHEDYEPPQCYVYHHLLDYGPPYGSWRPSDDGGTSFQSVSRLLDYLDDL
jgi:hypothetical protein